VQQTAFVGGVLVDPLSTPQLLVFTAPLAVVPAALAAVAYRPASPDFWDYDYLTVRVCLASIPNLLGLSGVLNEWTASSA
jgi:hypothetical protein